MIYNISFKRQMLVGGTAKVEATGLLSAILAFQKGQSVGENGVLSIDIDSSSMTDQGVPDDIEFISTDEDDPKEWSVEVRNEDEIEIVPFARS